MLGIVWFLAFQGAAIALLWRRGRVGGAAERVWLGSVCGSVLGACLRGRFRRTADRARLPAAPRRGKSGY